MKEKAPKAKEPLSGREAIALLQQEARREKIEEVLAFVAEAELTQAETLIAAYEILASQLTPAEQERARAMAEKQVGTILGVQ